MDSAEEAAYSTETVRLPNPFSVVSASLLVARAATAAPGDPPASGEATPAAAHPPGPSAQAQVREISPEAEGTGGGSTTLPPEPRRHLGFVQFGAALAVEVLGSSGAACSGPPTPCIFGSGGGMRIGAGYRFAGPFYLGAAYEFSKHDASKLLRLPILQQARAELRYLLDTQHVYEPYVVAGLGMAGYGSEWGIETVGPLAELGFGLEIQLSRTAVFGATTAYRLLWFRSFQDPAGEDRPRAAVSFVGFELMLEQRDPVGE